MICFPEKAGMTCVENFRTGFSIPGPENVQVNLSVCLRGNKLAMSKVNFRFMLSSRLCGFEQKPQTGLKIIPIYHYNMSTHATWAKVGVFPSTCFCSPFLRRGIFHVVYQHHLHSDVERKQDRNCVDKKEIKQESKTKSN